ncbi:hypothetical protein KEJ21_04695 [Candidatus Bathyarchaeota archaeon]|nr:hypothetical protein [Candidatus Bathyarchaeota archaeon]MBS7630249.1 hypothetical protein [Candidatus Bathyarchaeota archaeon]
MSRVIKNRKAISPILSTVLAILIVTLSMSAIFSYFVGYVTNFQQGRGSSRQEMIEIEDIWFNLGPPKYIIISIYNYGELDIKIVSVYINGLLVTAEDSNHQWPVVVHPKGLVDIHVVNINWKPYVKYEFKIVSERGSSFGAESFPPYVS